MRIQGTFGNDAKQVLDLNFVVGKVEKADTTVTESVTNETLMELVSLDVLGASNNLDGNIRIPCVLDSICPKTLSTQDMTFAITLRISVKFRLDKLPFTGVYEASEINFAVGDNTFSMMGGIKTLNPKIDTRNTAVQVIDVTFTSQHVDTLRAFIRDIGAYSYNIRVHGNKDANLLGFLLNRMHLVYVLSH